MLKNNIKKISSKGAFFNYLGKTLTTAIDAAVFILITKKLIVNDYGVYSFLMAVLSFFPFFISFGIPNSLLRFIPEYIEKNKRETALFIIKISLGVIIAIGFLLIVASFFIPNKNPFILNKIQLKGLFPLLVFMGILNIIKKAGEEILNALFMQVFKNVCDILTGLLKTFLFVVVLNYGLGIEGLVIVITAVTALQSLLYLSSLKSYFSGIKPPEKLEKNEIKRFFIFSAKSHLFIATAFFWDMAIDIYIIAYLLGAASTGFFSFASSISFFVLHWSPGIVLNPIISPLFVKQYTKHKDPAILKDMFTFYNKLKAFFAFPIILGIWSFIDKFVAIIYHNKYAPSILTLKILVLSVMIMAFTIPIRNIFDVFEKNEFSLYANIVVIYRICASLVFIRHFGITGAAYAYCSSMLLFFLIHLILLKRIINISYPLKAFLKILFNSLIMSAAIVILKSFMVDSLLWLTVNVIIAILIYLLVSYINKPFEAEERNLINESFGVLAWHF